MNTVYSIKNAAGETIAAFDCVLDVVRHTNELIERSKQAHVILHVLKRNADCILEKVCTVTGVNGLPNMSFKLIKEWNDAQKAAGKPSGLDEFYKAVGLCRACRGWGKKTNVPGASLPCKDCDGSGKHQGLRRMKLVVAEVVPGGEPSVLDLESGSKETCLKCYYAMRKSGQYDDFAQFRIEEDGHVVAIEVHYNMLWLSNVPPPKYFTPPKGVVVTGFASKSDALQEKALSREAVNAALAQADKVLESQYEAAVS